MNSSLYQYEAHKSNAVCHLLNSHGLLNGKNLLDVGCSTGAFLDVASNFNCHATGLDVDAEGGWFAEYSGEKNRIIHDFQLDEYKSDIKFDIVIMQEVIEHLSMPYNFFSNIKSILNQNAIIYFTTPNLSGWSAKLKNKKWCGYCTEGHYLLYNKLSVDLLMMKSGFSKIKLWNAFIPLYYQGKYKVFRYLEYLLQNVKIGGSLQGIYKLDNDNS